MSIKFSFNLPDEPYKNTFELNKTVECTYTGARFLLVRQDKTTGQLFNVEFESAAESDVNINNYNDTDFNFVMIDAQEFPLEAAYLTHRYTNADYEDFTEQLPTGEEYTYFYDANSVIHATFATQNLYYDTATNTFSELAYLAPAFTREQFDEIVANKIADMQSLLAPYNMELENAAHAVSLDLDKRDQWQTYLTWLENIETAYPNVDHWKIPFPPAPELNQY